VRLLIEDFCVRCGICIDTAPDLFMRDEGKDMVRVRMELIPDSLAVLAVEATKACAVSAIRIIE
jgi:ferredoxin